MGISAFGASGLKPGVCTSTTRPTAPYEGQMIYETDTDKVLVWNGSAWNYTTTPQTLEPGVWTTWTPTITANSGTFTTTTVEKARYTRINNLIFGQLSVKINNIGTASGGMIFTAPVTISSQYGGGHAVGSWRESDVSGESGVIIVTSTTTMRMDMYNAGTYLNTNDAYRGSFTYEAA